MNFWNGVLWLAFLAGAMALLAHLAVLRFGKPWEKIVRRLTWVSAGALCFSFLVLCLMFLRLELGFSYVWLYTGTWLPWQYRLAGAWTGREGSLLMWTACMAVVSAIVIGRAPASETESKARQWTNLFLLGLLLVFSLAVARQNLFGATPEFLLTGRPNGNGINPTLRNPYILIHPPMMFVAYALTIVPAAAGLGHMVSGTNLWSTIAGKASRLNWLLYTFAMGLGGAWAYYTLGFGGYWAWDPVEVANLLPWIALTAYIHAQMIHARSGKLDGIGPLLAILPFILTVFSTVSTRSGLWISVHAFTDPTTTFNVDPAARLLGILGIDQTLLPYVGIIFATLLVGLGLWHRRIAQEHERFATAGKPISAVLVGLGIFALLAPAPFLGATFDLANLLGNVGLGLLGLMASAFLLAAAPMLISEDEKKSGGWLSWLNVNGLAVLSVLLLSLALIVAILYHFAAVNGWSEAFWDARIPWLMTPLALGLILLLTQAQAGKTLAMKLTIGAWVVAALAGMMGGRGVYSVALASFIVVAGGWKMMQVSMPGSRRIKAGSLLLWVGAILNVVFWFNPPSAMLWHALELRWPVQLFGGSLALLGLYGAHAVAAGKQARWPYILVAALGAFYLAPVLAAAAYFLHAGRDGQTWKPARQRITAVYGVHFVVAMLFVGYAASTYFEDEASGELAVGESITIAGEPFYFAGARMVAEPGTPWAASIHPTLESDAGELSGTIYWELQTGSHYPLPGTLRTWSRDLYVTLDAVCFEKGGCTDDWVTVFESSGRVRADAEATAVRLTVSSLPGISLVWGALALFVFYGIPLVMIHDPAIGRKGSNL